MFCQDFLCRKGKRAKKSEFSAKRQRIFFRFSAKRTFSFAQLSYFVFLRIELLSSRTFVSPPFPKVGAVFLLRFALFEPYFLPPSAREAAICLLAASGEIPIPSQHLCRGFLHGNEGHIWHHRPSFQPARPYPASRQAAVRKSHYPQVRCHGLRSNAVICFVRLQVNRSPLSGVLAP